jgi:hypothetical protein
MYYTNTELWIAELNIFRMLNGGRGVESSIQRI